MAPVRRLAAALCVVVLCSLLVDASSGRGRGATGALQANNEDDTVKFKENVIENKPAGAAGEQQDREWDNDGKDGGTSIVLSNRNQLEALQQKLRNINEEAEKQRQEMLARAGQEDAKKRVEAERIKKHLSDKDLRNEELLKERERGHCAAPQLHNIAYSFQSRANPKMYLAVSKNGQARVTTLDSEQDKQEACFILQPGRATTRYVSLESLAYPGYFLRHSNWRLVASHKRDNDPVFNNEGTYVLEKGLVGCLDGFVSFESNAKGKFIQEDSGSVWVRNAYAAGARPAIASSWRPVVAVADTYFLIKARKFQPKQGTILAEAHQLRKGQANEYTYMFWLKALGKTKHFGNLFHKGATNRDRNPGVWFYPDSTKLHVRSSVTSAGNEGVDPETEMPLNQWVHVSITHNKAGRISVFFNGQQSATRQIGAPRSNDGPLYASDPWHEAANVEMADFRYYHRIATGDELRKAVDDEMYSEKNIQGGGAGSSSSSSSSSSSASK